MGVFRDYSKSAKTGYRAHRAYARQPARPPRVRLMLGTVARPIGASAIMHEDLEDTPEQSDDDLDFVTPEQGDEDPEVTPEQKDDDLEATPEQKESATLVLMASILKDCCKFQDPTAMNMHAQNLLMRANDPVWLSIRVPT